MAKNKPSGPGHYELLYLVANKYSEVDLPAITDKVSKLITDNQGVITYNEPWGKRRLAYKIQGFRHGYYFLLEFDMPSLQVLTVSNALRLSNDILRHQMLKVKPSTPADIKRRQDAVNRANQEDKTKAEDAGKAGKVFRKNKPELTVAPTEIKTEPVDIKALDEKLDQILGDTESLL